MRGTDRTARPRTWSVVAGRAAAAAVLAATMGIVLAVDAFLSEAGRNARAAARWGVEVVSLRPTAGGNLIDLRLRILDEERARSLGGRGVKPVLTHEATGARFIVPSPPKVGPLRARHMKQGRTAFVLFGNPGRLVKRGDRVTVQIGDLHLEDVEVQ